MIKNLLHNIYHLNVNISRFFYYKYVILKYKLVMKEDYKPSYSYKKFIRYIKENKLYKFIDSYTLKEYIREGHRTDQLIMSTLMQHSVRFQLYQNHIIGHNIKSDNLSRQVIEQAAWTNLILNWYILCEMDKNIQTDTGTLENIFSAHNYLKRLIKDYPQFKLKKCCNFELYEEYKDKSSH